MSRFDRQYAAAASVYGNAHEDDAQRADDARAKRADAAEHAAPAMYADAMREWAGMERGTLSIESSIRETRRLAALFGSDWTEGLPF